ncbi:MAG: hypothetical protein RLY31_2848 [Bacteroidota bacterium]|jgi:putative redox protein
MKIELTRKNKAVHFEASNGTDAVVSVDGSASVGGQGLGLRPMELVLASLASCSSIDVVTLLKKMRQPLEDIRVEVEGTRAEEEVPAVFRHIHLRFFLQGALDPEKARKAVGMSVGTYCSVARMLEKSATITWDVDIRPGLRADPGA